MAISKKQQGHVSKYVKEHYDTIIVRTPKGKKKEITDQATAQNVSVNKFINDAIQDKLDKK